MNYDEYITKCARESVEGLTPAQAINQAEARREFGEAMDKAGADKWATPQEVGVKHDTDKPRYDLIKPEALEELAKVLTHGARKYADDNWVLVLKGEGGKARYYAALQRHLQAWRMGESIDKDSGLHHLGHAFCCCMFLLQGELTEK